MALGEPSEHLQPPPGSRSVPHLCFVPGKAHGLREPYESIQSALMGRRVARAPQVDPATFHPVRPFQYVHASAVRCGRAQIGQRDNRWTRPIQEGEDVLSRGAVGDDRRRKVERGGRSRRRERVPPRSANRSTRRRDHVARIQRPFLRPGRRDRIGRAVHEFVKFVHPLLILPLRLIIAVVILVINALVPVFIVAATRWSRGARRVQYYLHELDRESVHPCFFLFPVRQSRGGGEEPAVDRPLVFAEK